MMIFRISLRLANLLLLILLLLIFLMQGCIVKRKVYYFPNPAFNTVSPILTPNDLPVYRLKPTDILSIRIKALNKETADYFNVLPENSFQQWNPAGLYVNGYSIDPEGNITLPEIGKVKIVGLTVDQAQKTIQEKVSSYIGKSTVLVKLISFRVTVLGEVKSPGYYYFYNDRATILEALAMAGDLTDLGNRTNIALVRQDNDGTQTVLINLNDPNLLASKYYFLMPNDAIYIQPLKAKYSRSNLNTLSLLGIVFGAVSTTILLINNLK